MISKAMRITELKEHIKDFGSIQLTGDDNGFPCMCRINVPAKELWNLRVGQELVVKVELPDAATVIRGKSFDPIAFGEPLKKQ